MPVTFENETCYSIEELSQILQTSQEEMINLVEKDFIHERQHRPYVRRSDLEHFFEQYFLLKGASGDRFYRLPEYLKNSQELWAKTIVKMYEKKVNFPASISPEQGEFLRSLICNVNPDNVIEIGCFTGISTIWMASGLEQVGSNATIHSIDLFSEILPWMPYRHGCLLDPYSYAHECVASAQLSHRIQFHKMNSVDAGKKIHEITNEPIDFLFIDGDHTTPGCLSDWMLFTPHVPVGGYVVLHDIYPEHCGWDGPRFVIDQYIKGNPQYELMELKTSPHNFGMAIARKLRAETTPILTSITDQKPQPISVRQNHSLLTKVLRKLNLGR